MTVSSPLQVKIKFHPKQARLVNSAIVISVHLTLVVFHGQTRPGIKKIIVIVLTDNLFLFLMACRDPT